MFSEVFDISQTISTNIKVFPGDSPYLIRHQQAISEGDPCNLSDFTMCMHCGTHIDAPLHFIENGKSVAELALQTFMGPAKVCLVDVKRPITATDLLKLFIEPNDRILLKIPFNERLLEASEYSNDYIGLDVSAANYLIEQKVQLIGTEYLSIENSEEPKVHRALLGAGIIIMEGLDLRTVEPGNYYLIGLPLKLENGNGSPVRAVLLK